MNKEHRAFLLRASRTYEWHVFMHSLVEEIRQGLQEREAEIKQEIEKLRIARKWVRIALEAKGQRSEADALGGLPVDV